MPALKGNQLLLKVGDGATPTEAFTTLAGIRTASLEINNNPIDVTTDDDVQAGTTFRNYITGVTDVSISGDGIATDATAYNDLAAKALAGTVHNFQMEDPHGVLEGPFRIGNLTKGKSYDDTVTFSISLVSSGAPTYTAA